MVADNLPLVPAQENADTQLNQIGAFTRQLSEDAVQADVEGSWAKAQNSVFRIAKFTAHFNGKALLSTSPASTPTTPSVPVATTDTLSRLAFNADKIRLASSCATLAGDGPLDASLAEALEKHRLRPQAV